MIVQGRIVGASPAGLTISVPYDPRFVSQQWDKVLVDIPDGTTITGKQRNQAQVLLQEIAAYTGESKQEVADREKWRYLNDHANSLCKDYFSLGNCSKETASGFIAHLIDFVLSNDIPLNVPLLFLCEDVHRATYSCLMHKKCIICGKPCDLHHVDRVGMGRDRNDICHIGMECLPLCREHHNEAHAHGDEVLMDKYHLETVTIDSKIAKLYRLGKRRTDEQQSRAAASTDSGHVS